MKKDELIRYRAGLAALLVSSSMFLGGCSLDGYSSSIGFKFKVGKDNSYVALEDSFINNKCIEECYVVEVHNKLTGENQIFIAKRDVYEPMNGKYAVGDTEYHYIDLMNNYNKLFYQNNERNTSFEFIKEIPLYDYMITLDLIKARYSYEDMEKILEEIKSVYKFESDKELVK
jgi:hypothetical protein